MAGDNFCGFQTGARSSNWGAESGAGFKPGRENTIRCWFPRCSLSGSGSLSDNTVVRE